MKIIYNFFLILLLSYLNSFAQNPGEIDLSFNSADNGGGNGANGKIVSSVIQPDGKIIIRGDFTKYDGIAINKIARINQDGTLDLSFNADYLQIINTNLLNVIAIQPDGKIILNDPYTFATSNGNYTSLNLLRLNPDGSRDTTFNVLSSDLKLEEDY